MWSTSTSNFIRQRQCGDRRRSTGSTTPRERQELSLRNRKNTGSNNKRPDKDAGTTKLEFGFTEQQQIKFDDIEIEMFDIKVENRPELKRANSWSFSIDDDSIDGVVEETDVFSDDDLDMKIADEDDIIVENTTMKMLGRHLKGLTQDFKKSGLPWEGYQCRSLLAGGSGVLFALPALIPSASFMFSAQWILQATLSVLADYFHVHHDSVWHGLDRYFATYSLLSSLYWAAGKVDVLAYIVLSPIPIGCYIMASRSKDEMNLAGWKRWHFGWHLTGILEILLVNYLSRHCPEVDSFLAPLCYTP